MDKEATYLMVLLEIGPEPEDFFSDAHTDWQIKARDLLWQHGLKDEGGSTHLMLDSSPKFQHSECSTALLGFYIWLTVQRQAALSSQAGYKGCNDEE